MNKQHKQSRSEWFKADRRNSRKVKNMVVAANALGFDAWAVLTKESEQQKLDRLYR
jgi:hypothetical protein